MRKYYLLLCIGVYCSIWTACSGGNGTLTQDEQTEVDDMMKKDQEKMDSMKRAMSEKFKVK